MFRIAPQQFIAFISEAPYLLRELPIAIPKPRIRLVGHRSVQRFERRSASASAAKASRRPSDTSASI